MRRPPLVALVIVLAVLLLVLPANGAPAQDVIVLPGAGSAEGIATGKGSIFYAGDLIAGDLYSGNMQSGEVSLLRDVPDGRMAVGMAVDVRHNLLFVAGGATGQGYAYDTRTGADRGVFSLAVPAAGTFINDVIVTRQSAWFTDSQQPVLYRVAIGPRGALGPVTTLPLDGPAADTSGEFNLNGIAATPDGAMLVVGHSGNGELYGVPATAARHGNRLAVVNAKFDTGFPPTADEYEVVIVDAR